jgi:hypothetical protein
VERHVFGGGIAPKGRQRGLAEKRGHQQQYCQRRHSGLQKVGCEFESIFDRELDLSGVKAEADGIESKVVGGSSEALGWTATTWILRRK